MADTRMKVSVIGNASIAIDDIDKLPVPQQLDIHVAKADFRDVMSLNAVASELGKSLRQMRRLISDGAFPESCVIQKQKKFWLRATVREWQKTHLETSEKYRNAPKGPLTRWKDEKSIERDEDKRRARLHPATERAMTDVREMNHLLVNDPKEFRRRHPKLWQYVKDRKLS